MVESYVYYQTLQTEMCVCVCVYADLVDSLFTANSFDTIDEDAFQGLPHLEYL